METGPSLLDQYLKRIGTELEMETSPAFQEDGTLLLDLGGKMPVHLQRQDACLFLLCELGAIPEAYREALFTMLMKGNFLGLETGSSALGVDQEGKKILLSKSVSYDLSYAEFKESLEEFVNYAEHWRTRIDNLLQGFLNAPI